MFDQEIAEANAGSGVVEGGFLAEFEAGEELVDLVGGGGVAEGEDFAGEEGGGGE